MLIRLLIVRRTRVVQKPDFSPWAQSGARREEADPRQAGPATATLKPARRVIANA